MDAEQVPVTTIMAKQVVCAQTDYPVQDLARQMLHGHFGCIPIVDERGHPRGIVTKTDLVEALLAPDSIVAQTATDVMMPIAIVLDEHATIAHCASMMALEDFHHVMIVNADGKLVGVVSSQDVVRWLAAV